MTGWSDKFSADWLAEQVTRAEERRWRPRWPATAKVYLIAAPGSPILMGRLRDVSASGMALQVKGEIELDTELMVMIHPRRRLAGKTCVRCIVRNRRGDVYGMDFMPRDNWETQDLSMLLTALTPTTPPVKKTSAGGQETSRQRPWLWWSFQRFVHWWGSLRS